jgi:hypothetical protein
MRYMRVGLDWWGGVESRNDYLGSSFECKPRYTLPLFDDHDTGVSFVGHVRYN